MNDQRTKMRVRFAPSPTGYLHVGGARTALFNWLYARHTSGDFLLRIEDTDQERSTEDFLQSQLESLKWLGLHWDPLENNKEKISHHLYRQSQNIDTYKKYANQLLEKGQAFYCFCSEETLAEKKQMAMAKKISPHYDGTCHKFSLEEAKAKIALGETATIRFKVPKSKKYSVPDLLRDDVQFSSDMIGDFVILRSDSMPVYNFCCVVDDHLMKITQVFRSNEHLNNTLKQMMLYEAFDWKVPQFVHLSLILGPDGKKLSKRFGATSCQQYKEKGVLPEALINYLSLLGWSSTDDQELFTVKELIEKFTLDRLNVAPAIFDEEKLIFINAHHLRSLPHTELWQRITPFLKKEKVHIQEDSKWQNRSLEVLKSYMKTLADAPALYKLLIDSYFKVTNEGLETSKWPETKNVILAWQNKLEHFKNDFINQEEFILLQKEIQKECCVKGKYLFMPLRVAILGKPHGVELKQFVPLLKISSLKERAVKTISLLQCPVALLHKHV